MTRAVAVAAVVVVAVVVSAAKHVRKARTTSRRLPIPIRNQVLKRRNCLRLSCR